MNDRPTAAELLAAARQFLEAELIPTLGDARLRFQTLVAANVLAIAKNPKPFRTMILSTQTSQRNRTVLPKPPRFVSIRAPSPMRDCCLPFGIPEKSKILTPWKNYDLRSNNVVPPD